MSKYKKPNHYPAADIEATNQGWVYTKNNNEVLSAIGQLDQRLAAEIEETEEPEVPEESDPE